MSCTLPCDVGLANGGRKISRSLKLLCLNRNIRNLSAIQGKSGYLLRQRGNERFVGNREVGPQVLSFGVDRIQRNFEPVRNHTENCFEL